MSTTTLTMEFEDIKQFSIAESLGEYLQNNIQYIRDNTTDKFVYFSTPTSNKQLPQIVIEMNSIPLETEAANNYMKSYTKDGIFYELFYKNAKAAVTIYFISRLNHSEEIKGLYLKGSKYNKYITELIKHNLLKYDIPALEKVINHMTLDSVEYAYRSNDEAVASEIQLEIDYNETWCNEYINGNLINSYTLTTLTY